MAEEVKKRKNIREELARGGPPKPNLDFLERDLLAESIKENDEKVSQFVQQHGLPFEPSKSGWDMAAGIPKTRPIPPRTSPNPYYANVLVNEKTGHFGNRYAQLLGEKDGKLFQTNSWQFAEFAPE